MHTAYQNPLVSRYASREIAELWGAPRRFGYWRRLWVALAEAQLELGVAAVKPEQVASLQAHVDLTDKDFERAAEYEKKLRHDVMAHVHAFGDACPDARAIIHLGATSCFVTDNTDLLQIRESLRLVRRRLLGVIAALASLAEKHRELPCLGLTHMQPAQPTTFGKRICLWLYDLVLDFEEIESRLARLKARSTKGTTGTQASFLKLFNGDHAKVRELERLVSQKMGFEESYPVTGQTYSRKVDRQVLDALSGICESAHKAATDLRLLSARKEIDEPFEKDQIGSSAMAYKRNPMRSERICALARYGMALPAAAGSTHATQWMERTLDDSAIRRIIVPQAFLTADAVLVLYRNVAQGLVAYPAMMARYLAEELPFMATENILMAAVQQGGDRQHLHEQIRRHSIDAAAAVKTEGKPNDLFDRLRSDPAFAEVDIPAEVDAREYVGRAPQQVDEFLTDYIRPILANCADEIPGDGPLVEV